MGCMSLAAGPNLIKQEIAGHIGGTMKVVQEAAFFISRGADQRSEFGLQEQLLAGLGVHRDDEGDSVLGELRGFL